MAELNTLERIRAAALDEFIKKGFRCASLRNIVKTAGVTTGAFYGYYKSKEALFDSLIGPHYDAFVDRFKQGQSTFQNLPADRKSDFLQAESCFGMDWMVDHVYQHKDIFRLLTTGSEGTRYENFIRDLVEIELDAAENFSDSLRALGVELQTVDRQLAQLLVCGVVTSFFELIIQDIPLEQARVYVNQLQQYSFYGWRHILGF